MKLSLLDWVKSLFDAKNRRVAPRHYFLFDLFQLSINGKISKIFNISYSGLLIQSGDHINDVLEKSDNGNIHAELIFFQRRTPCQIKLVSQRAHGIAFTFIHQSDELLQFLRPILESIRVGQCLSGKRGQLEPGIESTFTAEDKLKLTTRCNIGGQPTLICMAFDQNYSTTISFDQDQLSVDPPGNDGGIDNLYKGICFLLGSWETDLIPNLEVQISQLFQEISDISQSDAPSNQAN